MFPIGESNPLSSRTKYLSGSDCPRSRGGPSDEGRRNFRERRHHYFITGRSRETRSSPHCYFYCSEQINLTRVVKCLIFEGEKEDATEELLTELKAEREGQQQTILDLQNIFEKKVRSRCNKNKFHLSNLFFLNWDFN